MLPTDNEIENWQFGFENEYEIAMSHFQTEEGFTAFELGMKRMRQIAQEIIDKQDIDPLMTMGDLLWYFSDKMEFGIDTKVVDVLNRMKNES